MGNASVELLDCNLWGARVVVKFGVGCVIAESQFRS